MLNTKFKTLHEAIIHVLTKHSSASYEEIAATIEKENLWLRKGDQTYPQSFQIRLRTTVSRKYKHLFTTLVNGKIALKE
jgi:hypothetical protein